MLSAPAASFSPNMTVLSQVLALPSDTANDGQTRLSVPKHSQTSQEVRKTRFDWSQVSSWGLAAGGEALRIKFFAGHVFLGKQEPLLGTATRET